MGSYIGPDASGFGGHDKEFGIYSKSNRKLAECSQNLICVFRGLLRLPQATALLDLVGE